MITRPSFLGVARETKADESSFSLPVTNPPARPGPGDVSSQSHLVLFHLPSRCFGHSSAPNEVQSSPVTRIVPPVLGVSKPLHRRDRTLHSPPMAVFLDLPDELLELIFAIARVRYWNVDYAAGRMDVRLLLVQKSRLEPIVEKLFSAYIDGPPNGQDPLTYYARLLLRPPEIKKAVRALMLDLPVDPRAALACAALIAQLPSLEHLFISSSEPIPGDQTLVLPLGVLQACATIRDLFRLEFWGRCVLPPGPLPPLPRLQVVRMYASSLDTGMSSYLAAAHIKRLHLYFSTQADATFDAGPLATVEDLVVEFLEPFFPDYFETLVCKLRRRVSKLPCTPNALLFL